MQDESGELPVVRNDVLVFDFPVWIMVHNDGIQCNEAGQASLPSPTKIMRHKTLTYLFVAIYTDEDLALRSVNDLNANMNVTPVAIRNEADFRRILQSMRETGVSYMAFDSTWNRCNLLPIDTFLRQK